MLNEGRVALVSGGGRGIGKAISLALSEMGVKVAVNFNRDERAAVETAEEIVRRGGVAIPYQASVSSYPQLESMVTAATTDLGPIGILVHNAGVISKGRSVERTEMDEVEEMFRVHALGAFALAKLLLPNMRLCERGDIILVSSITAHLNLPNGAPYQMAKAAAESLAFTLAKEVRADGIHVNVVAPGVVDTDMGRRLLRAVRQVEDPVELRHELPYGRVCQPEDVAEAVRYLVSDAASYLNGQRICVDGGGWHW